MPLRRKWTDEIITDIVENILPKYRIGELTSHVCPEIERKYQMRVTPHMLKSALRKAGAGAATEHMQYVGPVSPDVIVPGPTKTSPSGGEFDSLLRLAKGRSLPLEEVCDRLDLSPSKARDLIARAQAAGMTLDVSHDHISLQRPEPSQHVQETTIPPVVGERQTVGVISDTHLGSKYCMRDQLVDFVHYAYDRGVREILHPGDVLDGSYEHGRFELTHHGLEDQTRDLFETLPKLDGLTYHAITGNHDETAWAKSGVNVGGAIEGYFREWGRDDLKFYGDRGALLRLKGATVELWHPRGGAAYARSYRLQKHIEGYTAVKPQVLLVGHFHQFCYVFERGVHGLLCPTFQGSMSKFSKSLGGWQAQGGLVLSWDLTEHGTIRDFVVEKRSYYERERPVEVHQEIDARPIDPVRYRSGAVR